MIQVVVVIEGGCVQSVYADTQNVEVVVIDHDTDGADLTDDPWLRVIDPEKDDRDRRKYAFVQSWNTEPWEALDPGVRKAAEAELSGDEPAS